MSIRLFQEAGIVDINLFFDERDHLSRLFWRDRIVVSDRFVMIIGSCFVKNSFPISFGNGVKFEFGGSAL